MSKVGRHLNGGTIIVICIVSGPTSVGKTTFIKSTPTPCPGMTEKPHLHFASEGLAVDSEEDRLFHYNILRPIDFCNNKDRLLPYRLARYETKIVHSLPVRQFYWHRLSRYWRYDLDPYWKNIRDSQSEKTAILLMANLRTLKERAGVRTVIEDGALDPPYNSQYWLDVYEKISLAAVYQLWIRELRDARIRYTLIDSNDSKHRILNENIDIARFVSGPSGGSHD